MTGYLKQGQDCTVVNGVESLWGAMSNLQLAKC